METGLIRVDDKTLHDLREFVLRKHGKMHGIGAEASEAIKKHIAEAQ